LDFPIHNRNVRSTVVDFSKPEMALSMKSLVAHEAASFLIALYAFERDLAVRFYRSQSEAAVDRPLLARTVSDATLFSISSEAKTHYFCGSQSDKVNLSAALVTKDKLKTKALLHAKNLNTPVGGVVSSLNAKLLSDLFTAGVRRFVVKPVGGSMGQNTHLNQTAKQVVAILRGNPETKFILEQHVAGQEHRLFVVGQEVVAAYQRIPGFVVGNGVDSIRTLCGKYDDLRKTNPFTADRLLDHTEVELALLLNDRKWTDIPKPNEVVNLSKDGVLSGQNAFPWSLHLLSQETKQLAMKAMQTVSGRAGALDMIIDSRGVPYVLEINLRAMIAPLSFPWPTGSWNMNVPKALVDDIFGKVDRTERSVVSFDFAAMRAEIFRDERKSRGVNAEAFMQLE
jgi:cyanophycin synthetase